MLDARSVLYCPFGERGNEYAMRRIARLVGAGSRITILDVLAPGQSHVRRPLRDAMSHDRKLEGIVVDTIADTGNRSDAILDHAASGYDLIVVTPEDDKEAIKSTKLLVVQSELPLLVMRPRVVDSDRVLVAVNPKPRNEELNRRLLGWGDDLASTLDCGLDVVHAWEYWGEDDLRNSGFLSVDLDNLDRRIEVERAARLADTERLVSQAGLELEAQNIHVPKGRTSSTIAKAARSLGASVIVAGSVRRQGIRRLIMGNSAEGIVEAAPCSVLVVG